MIFFQIVSNFKRNELGEHTVKGESPTYKTSIHVMKARLRWHEVYAEKRSLAVAA